MYRDFLLCLLSSLNLLLFSFIGINSAALARVSDFSPPQPEHILQKSLREHILQQYLSLEKALAAPADTHGSEDTPEAPPNQAEPYGYLSIPKIDVFVPLLPVSPENSNRLEESLTQGVITLEDFIPPHLPGKNLVFGHSSDFPWLENPLRTVFTLLPELQAQDVISVIGPEGTFRYRVTETFVSDPSLEDLKPSEEHQLVLTTCYPIGFTDQRYVVVAQPF